MNFYKELISKTGKRKESFQLMLDRIKTRTSPLVVETGCSRQDNNFDGDGMSSLIFDSFTEHHQGEFYSVDINPDHVDFTKKLIKKGNIICSDSVSFLFELNKKLRTQNKQIDLLYLDSFDFERNNPHPSSLHHIMELTSIWPSCLTGTIIAIDDNFPDGTGKGQYVSLWMEKNNIKPIFKDYQIIWEIP